MPKLPADGTSAQSFTNYPKDWYLASVKGATISYSRGTGAPMAVVDWKPEKGDTIGEVDNPGSIREWVMIGGMSSDGQPMRTDKLFDRYNALGLKRDYTCCGTKDSNRPFIVKKEDGKYYCPHCGNIAKIDVFYNDDGTLPWDGLKARIQVTIEKMENSDEERNRINRVVPVTR